MPSSTSLMPTACPDKDVLRLIFFLIDTDAAAVSNVYGFVIERIERLFESSVLPG